MKTTLLKQLLASAILTFGTLTAMDGLEKSADTKPKVDETEKQVDNVAKIIAIKSVNVLEVKSKSPSDFTVSFVDGTYYAMAGGIMIII